MAEASTRGHIVEAADRIFYENGFDHTSFADIAAAVKISRGNFYHHFKTKDDILDAVIERRIAATRAMLDGWEIAGETPEARIASFIEILHANCEKIQKFGCPVGTLAAELAKLDHRALPSAVALFTLFREWLRRQFAQLGCGPSSDQYALRLLARSQGIATLANAFRDRAFIDAEVAEIHDWLGARVKEAKSRMAALGVRQRRPK